MMLAERVRGNYLTLKQELFNKGIVEPYCFKKFVENELPEELPEVVSFDSAFQRGQKLLRNDEIDPILYGRENEEIFAVEYTWFEQRRLTIFLYGIDYRAAFAHIIKKNIPDIPLGLATKISQELTHDDYYLIRPFNYYRNALLYSNAIVNRSRYYVEEGETLKDLLNGDTLVFSVNRKRYIDIDDELPSAFVIDRVLYIYQP
ncbi:MAG: hypothetical protein IJ217_02040 [Clostridia bacterium]|nr:hypothetical protein [Clostridia bacterium]